jgi:hypothetical protein
MLLSDGFIPCKSLAKKFCPEISTKGGNHNIYSLFGRQGFMKIEGALQKMKSPCKKM